MSTFISKFGTAQLNNAAKSQFSIYFQEVNLTFSSESIPFFDYFNPKIVLLCDFSFIVFVLHLFYLFIPRLHSSSLSLSLCYIWITISATHKKCYSSVGWNYAQVCTILKNDINKLRLSCDSLVLFDHKIFGDFLSLTVFLRRYSFFWQHFIWNEASPKRETGRKSSRNFADLCVCALCTVVRCTWMSLGQMKFWLTWERSGLIKLSPTKVIEFLFAMCRDRLNF